MNFFETSRGSLQEGDGQSSGYPVPLDNRKTTSKFLLDAQ